MTLPITALVAYTEEQLDQAFAACSPKRPKKC